MARETNKLTARGVATTTAPGRYGDGEGLYLVIDPGDSRRWLMIFRQGGKQREMGFGSASTVTLADARRRRDEVRRAVAEGRDPIGERKAKAAAPVAGVTVGAFADTLVPEIAKGFRNAKHAAQWTSTLDTYAGTLKAKALADITTDHVLSVLNPIWTEKSETASRLRGRIEKILDAAKARGPVKTPPGGAGIWITCSRSVSACRAATIRPFPSKRSPISSPSCASARP